MRIGEEIDSLATRFELAEGAVDSLQRLVRLVDWSEPNFVPKSGPGRADRKRRPRERHRRLASNLLAESLSGLELEPVRAASRIGDIGSGAGFPGLVLAIALPQTRVTLIEKRQESCRFLRRTTARMGLDNVEVVEGPVQQWSEGAGTCDLVTSRKVLGMHVMLKLSAPLLAPGGTVALWPGSSDFDEEAADDAADAAEAAGLRLARVHRLESERRGKRVVKHLYTYVKEGQS